MFTLAVLFMLAAVVFFLSYPFWNRDGMGPSRDPEVPDDPERVDLEIEKQRMLASLAELDLERVQGRLSAADYERLKAKDEHRLAAILGQIDRLATKKPKPVKAGRRRPAQSGGGLYPWIAPVALAVLVLGGSSGIYSYVTGKIGLDSRRSAVEQQARASQGMPNPAEMVARLEARLRENPDDLQGQLMAGRSYMALNRLEDAKKAWTKVLELDRRSHEAHYHLGLILLQQNETGDPATYKKALAHFDTALINVPREPAVLWYRGVALVHLQRFQEADESWTQAVQNLPLGSEDAEFVKQALKSLRAGNPPLFQ